MEKPYCTDYQTVLFISTVVVRLKGGSLSVQAFVDSPPLE